MIRSLLKRSETHGALLECGGGAGFYTQRFLTDGYNVTCVDLSEYALKENYRQAVEHGLADNLTLTCGDFVGSTSSLGRYYDHVVFIKVLHHFPSLTAIEAAVSAGVQTCRPGGRVIIFEPNGANILWKLLLSMVRDKASGRSKWFFEQNLRFTTPGNISRILEKQNVHFTMQYHYVLPGFILEKEFFGVGLLRLINRYLEQSILKRFAFNISFIIEMAD